MSVMCAWRTLLLWGLRDSEIGLGFGKREAYIYLHGCVGWAICLWDAHAGASQLEFQVPLHATGQN